MRFVRLRILLFSVMAAIKDYSLLHEYERYKVSVNTHFVKIHSFALEKFQSHIFDFLVSLKEIEIDSW